MSKQLFALLCLGVICTSVFAQSSSSAPASGESETGDGSEGVGPANVKLQFHAPAQYPVQYGYGSPYGSPYGGFSPYGGYSPYGAGFNPYGGGFPQPHPAFQPFLPHPAAYAPFYGGFAEESVDISDKNEEHAEGPSDDSDAAPSPFADIQTNWQNYFAGPTSQFQWPGAEEARPGVHPTLGGTLNPFSPLGNPSHPYPFPMHQGLKNGPNHPRPFTPFGQYYPGTSGSPFAPQFAFGGGFGFNPYFGIPPYFPGAQNGNMGKQSVSLQDGDVLKKILSNFPHASRP